MDTIDRYFPDITSVQRSNFLKLKVLYEEQNAKINVISRKDMESFYLHHVLHSLTITAFVNWNSKCRLLDLGTGGGFPAIPLAIYYPEIQFTAIDGTGKKIKVLTEIAEQLGLKNLKAMHLRAEDCKEKFHFIVSRAVCSLDQLIQYSKPLLLRDAVTALPNGVLAYKGGDLTEEIREIKKKAYFETYDIHQKFPEAYFQEKKLVYLQLH
ncbi:MAG: 16S rRNA (guanine(527)-N(7))-methyltransferase RsmG [Saprospiraceae bacterium]|nr:16S rRNA (guanine(527)-N(7))-methyltransferase RsmG [Saprospiraceae bacterium]MBK8297526.1 16S rRNA (guanine(527)-N(7))-methyltransferase RsmG [Saprospiraceae bacterium]